jgi:endonuclease/exonuclease/phosphatase family metal-dependent hydrolase
MEAQSNDSTPRRKRPSLWHAPMWWANGACVLVLLLTYLAPHVNPTTWWWPALLAFVYPYQLLLHLGFVAWWLVFRRKRALLSLLAIAIGWSHIGDHFQLWGNSTPPDGVRGGVKVMSYNVRLFDLYNWSGNRVTHKAIFDQLAACDADILCLQEFFHSPDTRFFRTKDKLVGELGYTAVHDQYTHVARFQQHFGIAIFSRLPIVARGTIPFPDSWNNQCIWADVVLPDDTVRVYNAHLASYHFGNADYKFIESLDGDTQSDSLRSGGMRILKRLRKGVRQRAEEARILAEHLRQSPHPVIYCGDMNDVPMSYSYHQLRRLLCDAFTESGSGVGGTYNGRLPSLRIDHIMHGPELASWAFFTHPEQLSDHRAISCMIGRRK